MEQIKQVFLAPGWWMSQHSDDNVNLILVGNKCDLESQRVFAPRGFSFSIQAVSTKEGQDLAKKHGIHFFETSASTDTNVDEVFAAVDDLMSMQCFEDLAKACVERLANDDKDSDEEEANVVSITSEQKVCVAIVDDELVG